MADNNQLSLVDEVNSSDILGVVFGISKESYHGLPIPFLDKMVQNLYGNDPLLLFNKVYLGHAVSGSDNAKPPKSLPQREVYDDFGKPVTEKEIPMYFPEKKAPGYSGENPIPPDQGDDLSKILG